MILFPISLYPFFGVFVSAYFKALGTARYLHKPVRHLPQIIPPLTYQCILHSTLTPRRWPNIKWLFSWKSVNGIIDVGTLPLCHLAIVDLLLSFWICCGTFRRPPYRWTDIHHFEPYRGSYVGSRYVLIFPRFLIMHWSYCRFRKETARSCDW